MKLLLTYTGGCYCDFDMPEGKNWADVESWYVKWDMLYLMFKDGTKADIEIFVEVENDTKRPAQATICDDDYEELACD